MFFINFVGVVLFMFGMFFFLKIFIVLNSGKTTKRVFFFKGISTTPYKRLRKNIDTKAAKIFAKLTDSSKKNRERDDKWLLSVESHPGRVQRRQREVLRSETHIPLDTGNLNLDIIPLLIKLILIILFSTAMYSLNERILFPPYVVYNCLLLFSMFSLTHIVMTRLVLRESRFWWWRPWPALLHIYHKGLISRRYERVFYVFLLQIPFWWVVLACFAFFLREKFMDTYFIYRFRRFEGVVMFGQLLVLLHPLFWCFFTSMTYATIFFVYVRKKLKRLHRRWKRWSRQKVW